MEAKKRQAGHTIAEVVLALVAMGMVFSVILPGFYLTYLLENRMEINRKDSYRIRYLELYFKKQVYQSDVIYIKGENVFLRDLENAQYYDAYSLKNSMIMREKYQKEDETLVSIGLGGISQFEEGFSAFSIRICPDAEGLLVISYQLEDEKEGREYELTIEHGKEIKNIA